MLVRAARRACKQVAIIQRLGGSEEGRRSDTGVSRLRMRDDMMERY